MTRRFGTPKAERGFTLVELMVAVTGGLFVTMAVFVLSKQTTSVYQAESRISNATLGSVVGFERLRADVERAGYLVSPNVGRDPKRCGMPDVTWPSAAGGVGQYQQHLSSVFIEPSAAANVPPEITANGIHPDEITLAGSYASIDQFPTGPIYNNGVFNVVTLQVASPPMARLGFQPAGTPAQQRAILAPVFGKGRILRIVDTSGGEQYGMIADIDTTVAPPQILIATTNSNAILYRGTNTAFKCGIQGNGDRSLVNVVNLVRYSLRNLSGNAQYAPLYDNGVSAGSGQITAAAADSRRGELVREELDAAGAPIRDANDKPIVEVVTEFAVDLAFGLTVSQIVPGGSGAPVEKLVTVGAGSAAVADWAGETWGARALAEASSLTPNTVAPQFIRTVRVRLGVRSREADRQTGMPTFGGDGGTLPVMPGLYRVGLGTNGAGPFARVRSVQADVALRNHRGATWL